MGCSFGGWEVVGSTGMWEVPWGGSTCRREVPQVSKWKVPQMWEVPLVGGMFPGEVPHVGGNFHA